MSQAPASSDPIADLLGKSPEQQAFWDRVRAWQDQQRRVNYGYEEPQEHYRNLMLPYLQMMGLYVPQQNMMRGMFGLRQRVQ